MSAPAFDIRCIVSGSETGGAVAVFEEIVPPGGGPPLHTHRNQIEIFHIMEGTFRFHVDGAEKEISAGSAAVVPAGVAHAFKNVGDAPAKLHFELLPANRSEESFEKLVNEGDQIKDPAAFFDEFDMDLVGPPLA